MDYPIVIAPLSKEDGGGYAGFAFDLPGCMSDGDTPDKALKNTKKAVAEWIALAKKLGREIPKPGTASERARAEKKALKEKLAEALTAFEKLDNRVESLADQIREIQERLDHFDSWGRFSVITGVSYERSGETVFAGTITRGNC